MTDSIFTAQAKVKPKVNFVHLPIVQIMKCQQYVVSFIVFISPIILWFKSFSVAVWLSEFKTASSPKLPFPIKTQRDDDSVI